MLSVYGESGAFKDLKQQLLKVGIQIQTIHDFQKESDIIKKNIVNISDFTQVFISKQLITLESEYNSILSKIDNIEKTGRNNFFKKIFLKYRIFILKKQLSRKIKSTLKIENNEEKYFKKTQKKLKKELGIKKDCLDSNKHLYYGALAEIEAENHLKDNQITSSHLINDFYRKLNRPIAMKGGNDWIYSFQIDHLVINKKGIFCIETKNWSKSFENGKDFTPVYQCKRHGHAFYFSIQKDIEKKLKKKIRRFDIVTRKQSTQYRYHQSRHVYEMNINSLNHFINSKTDILSEDDIGNILNFLQ